MINKYKFGNTNAWYIFAFLKLGPSLLGLFTPTYRVNYVGFKPKRT